MNDIPLISKETINSTYISFIDIGKFSQDELDVLTETLSKENEELFKGLNKLGRICKEKDGETAFDYTVIGGMFVYLLFKRHFEAKNLEEILGGK